MGFLDKIKQAAGIGGVKVILDIPTSYDKEKSQFTGKISLIAKTDQHIKKLHVELQENRLEGYNENTTTKEYVLGNGVVKENFDIKAGEALDFDFEVPFTFKSYELDRKIEEKIESSLTRKLNEVADKERSKFTVTVFADQEGSLMPSTDSKSVKLTGSEKGNLSE